MKKVDAHAAMTDEYFYEFPPLFFQMNLIINWWPCRGIMQTKSKLVLLFLLFQISIHSVKGEYYRDLDDSNQISSSKKVYFLLQAATVYVSHFW